MSGPIGSILRAATRTQDESLNVLTFPVHERYQSGLGGSKHRFWLVRTPEVKDWNSTYAPLPANHILLDPARGDQQLPPDIDFDVVLSQNKFGNFQLADKLRHMLHLPLVSLEHTFVHPSWPQSQVDALKTMRGDINVFISEVSREAWGWGPDEAEVIRHGVATNTFCPPPQVLPRKQHVLTVVNDYSSVERHWCCGYPIYQQVIGNLPRLHLGSSRDGSSKPARDIPDLVRHYQEAAVFLNTSTFSPIPCAVLEAMACGQVVISLDNCLLPQVITDGENGFLSNDPRRMTSLLRDVLAHPGDFEDMRANARKTILEKFSMERFVRSWDDLLRRAANIPYRGI